MFLKEEEDDWQRGKNHQSSKKNETGWGEEEILAAKGADENQM